MAQLSLHAEADRLWTVAAMCNGDKRDYGVMIERTRDQKWKSDRAFKLRAAAWTQRTR
jgi:hypothetical protein